MIDGKKVLGLITARGGSKGLPGKNIKDLCGKPLIAWTIEAAKSSKYIDTLILSSDDDKIISVAKQFGCEVPFIRSAELAGDKTPSIDVVIDALEKMEGYEWLVLLQPTSPLRTTADIDEAITKCISLNAPACVSVCESQESPFWMFFMKDAFLTPVIDRPLIERRQDLPKAYSLNGAIYIARVEWIKQTKNFLSEITIAYEMPIERSIDIDNENDFALVELNLKSK